jgi:hypothetical protein
MMGRVRRRAGENFAYLGDLSTMTRTSKPAAGLCVLAALSLASASAHAAGERPWSLDLKAGAQYDDNVTVEQTDITTGVADAAALFEASAGYKLLNGKKNKVDVGYDFSQSLYSKENNFDIQSHSLSLTGSTTRGGVTYGGSYYFFHLLLGGKDFLDMHLISPSVAGFVRPNLYVRGWYYFFDKTFHTAPSRDATNQQPGVAAMYFFDQSKAYVSVGGNYEIENAKGPEFDYKGYALTTALKLPLPIAGRQGRLKFEYVYSRRDYDNITPSIGVKRKETRSTLRADAVIPVTDHLSFDAEYKYVNRDSNLPIANYDENVVGGSFHYAF